jgi:type I restriction enzyme, S subunit
MSEGSGRQLPPGWVWAPLNDLGSWAGGGTPSKDNPAFWTNGHVPWVSPKDMKSFEIHGTEDRITEDAVTKSATCKLQAGTVLMVTRSGILRHTFPVAVARLQVAVNQDLKALTPHDGAYPDFVAYALLCFGQQILHACSKDGTTVQSIEFAALKRFMIPLAPRREQQRITDTLDELFSDLDAGVAALERVREKLKLYRASVLKAAVEGALTAEWRAQHPHTEHATELLKRILLERRRRWEEDQIAKFKAKGQEPPKNWKPRYKEPVAPDTTDLPPLPEGWCWASLDQIGRLDRGRSKHRPRDAAFLYDGPYPFIQTGDVRKARQYLVEHSQTYSEAGLKQSRLWPVETLCITIAANIAETAILSYPACFPDSVVGVLFELSLASVRYVELFIRSARTRISAYAPATAQKNINNEILRVLAIPLPPFSEQQAIVEAAEDQLSVIDHLEAELEAKLASAQALQQAILGHAFTGQLVPQDPNDEPASELLKRIAAELEARAREIAAAKQGKKKAVRPGNSRRGRPEKNNAKDD